MTRWARVPRQATTGRRLAALAVLFAFVLQSFAVQTHLHAPAQPQAAAHVAATGKVVASSLPAKAPLKSQDPIDQNGCRLCQELLHSSAFITPAIVALAASLIFVAAAFAALPATTAASVPAFAWQSRAPPRR